MSKTKTPFLSMGSQGTIADTLTSQKHGQMTMVRTKPTPTDPRSLPQMYQRWLYEDYAYLWTQQSAATKQWYATAGSRYHQTGFQYWMHYQLTYLPDIAGMWHLDEKAGATATDFSRNTNHGVIFGASPIVGIIDGGSFFDGINDRVDVPNAPSLQITGDLTIEASGRIDGWEIQNQIVFKSHLWEYEFFVIRAAPNEWLVFRHGDGATESLFSAVVALSLGVDYHFATVRTASPKQVHFYLNGAFISTAAYAKTPLTSNILVRLGYRSASALWNGMLDHLIIYNRAEDATEILRHSLRRYPLQ